jgi:hypothetical protein
VDKAIAVDAFNLLCGARLGGGIHREVYACRLRPDLVVKVETDTNWRYFANVHEMKFWDDNQFDKAVSRWLAPAEYLSPDGRILLQRRVEPLRQGDKLPDKLPAFLSDIKRENFGWLDGRLVSVDYALAPNNPSLRLRKVDWH